MSATTTAAGLLPIKRRFAGLTAGQWAVLVIAWLVTMGLGYLGYQRFNSAAPVIAKGVPVAAARGTIAATVNTTGSVVAGTQAKITFKASGRVSEVLVQVGETVRAAQPLARLDTTDLQLQLTQSRAQLSSSEAKLAQMQQGSRREEIAAAEAALRSAQAKFDLLQAGPTDADVQAAQAGVANAKSSLASTQAKLNDLLAQPKPEDVRSAQLQLEKSKNSLWATQINRDATCGNGREDSASCKSANAQVAASETDVANSVANLNRVSQPAKAYDINSAQEALNSAQVSYNSTVAKLQQVRAGATSADLAAAQASVDSATRDLALKRTPYTDADFRGQRATVDQNKASVSLAEYQLNNATLVAPFAATVSSITLNAGEMTGSNAITVVDPKAVRIDATVDESDVARLQLGQTADITFDSLTGRRFAGKVSAIAPSGTVQQGVVTYLVSLSVDNADGALKPGMTANANIVYLSKSNVVMVPNRALRAQGRDRVVEVAGESGNEIRPVQVGLSNDQFTEIVSGVQEGEQVVIAATTTSAPRVGGVPGIGGGMPGGERAPVIIQGGGPR